MSLPLTSSVCCRLHRSRWCCVSSGRPRRHRYYDRHAMKPETQLVILLSSMAAISLFGLIYSLTHQP